MVLAINTAMFFIEAIAGFDGRLDFIASGRPRLPG
jgi:hypothetical protein